MKHNDTLFIKMERVCPILSISVESSFFLCQLVSQKLYLQEVHTHNPFAEDFRIFLPRQANPPAECCPLVGTPATYLME
jgi:hypothetical protein